MEIVFSKHAVEQMHKRLISANEVEFMVQHPDGLVKQSHDKEVFYKRFPKRTDNLLAVVAVRLFGNILEIVTVMHHFEVRK